MKEFIDLHNRTVSRDEIQTVIALAKEQNNTEVIYRLSKILNDHPDSKRFNINIINYPQETDNQAGLAGTRHSGDYREALDECGRLKKGWHFVDGKVVKVQKRSGLLSQYTEKEFGHPFPKSLKEKFKELNWKYDRKNKRYYTPVPENEVEKEQQAQMLAFIEQEKSRIEANSNFPSASSSAKSAPSDSSSNKNTPKIQIIPPYPIYIESDEENDDYIQLEKELINLMGDKFEVWANNIIEKKRKTRLSERSKEIKANIATLKNKEIGTTAYEYVREEYGYNYTVRKKGTKKYEVNLTIDRYGRFNPNEDYYNTFKTPEECSAFIIKTLDEKNGFYYRNWYGLSELQNKINELKGYQYSKQFHYEEEREEATKTTSDKSAPSDSSSNKTTLHKLNFSDVNYNKKIVENLKNNQTGEYDLLKKDMIGINFSLAILEKYLSLEQLSTLYGKEKEKEAKKDYAFVKERIEWTFNHNIKTAKRYHTLNDCKEFFAEKLPTLLAKGGQWLEAKAQGKNSATAKGQFTKVVKQTFDEIALIAVLSERDKKLQGKKAPKEATKTTSDKSALSDSSTTITNTPTIATTLIASSTQPTRIRLSVANSKQEENYNKIAYKNGFINAEKLKQLLEVWKKDKDFYFEEGFINPADFAKTAPASKEKGIFTLKNIVSKDNLRPAINGVLIEKDKYVATDAMNLLIVKRFKNDGLKTGTIYDPTPEPQYSKSYRGTAPFADDQTIQNSRYINGNIPFPKYEDVVNIPNYKVKMFELAPIINTLYASLEIGKRIHTEDYRMVININGKESGYFMSVKLLFNALQALKANGSEKAMFLISKEGFIYIISDNGNIALTVSAKEYDGSVRGHFIQLPTIELTVPKEFVPETKATLSAPNSLFGTSPEINTLAFKKMKVTELRAFTLEFYRLFLKGKRKEIEKHLKEVVFTSEGGRKIAYGEAMYSAKAAVIEHLGSLIKNSTYNNWGDRKPSDSEEILGYLNFKSKITIDGKKRHVRIAISVDKDRNLKFKSYDVGKKKSASTHKGVKPFNGGVETLSNESTAKTVPNSALSAPEVFVEHSPDPATQSAPSITPRNNSLANKMATLQNRTFETFIIAEPQMQAFLGDVERKTTGSTAITLTGGAGSGKTRFAFQFINALAQNYKVGHASLEEQPDSKLYFDKVHQYLDETAQANVEAPEIENMQDLQALIERNDVIVIDSFTKIREWDRNFLLDRDLRKKYNGKLFLIIFQQTSTGNMRGGSESEFDGDIILFTNVFPDYRENYIYPSKNRYNSTPREQLRYSVYYQQLLPDESSPSESSPATSNTYEVIY